MNPSNTIEFVLLHTPTASIRIPIQNWKNLRDARVVKQDLDYSCGAASLATLLNEFYGQSVTEEVLLKAMEKDDLRASFEDMQKALPRFGFKAQGFAAWLADPSLGNRSYSKAQFLEMWQTRSIVDPKFQTAI